MRELIFKNLTSDSQRRRDLYVSEINEKNGIKTVTTRHSIYIIKEHNKVGNLTDVMEVEARNESNMAKRHIFILKKKDTRLKKDSFICDVVGKFYAVVKDEVFLIAFKHSFEIDFLATQTAN